MTEDLIRDLLSANKTEMARLGNEMAALHVELVRIGERQTSTIELVKKITERLDDHDERLRAMEVKQPQLNETRSWVLLVAAAIVSMFFSFVTGRILPKEPAPAFPPRAAIIDTRSTTVVVA